MLISRLLWSYKCHACNPLLHKGCFFIAWIYMYDHEATPCGRAVKVNQNCSSLFPFVVISTFILTVKILCDYRPWGTFIPDSRYWNWVTAKQAVTERTEEEREGGRELSMEKVATASTESSGILCIFMTLIYMWTVRTSVEKWHNKRKKKTHTNKTHTCRGVCSICASCSVPEELWKAGLSYLIEHPNSQGRFQQTWKKGKRRTVGTGWQMKAFIPKLNSSWIGLSCMCHRKRCECFSASSTLDFYISNWSCRWPNEHETWPDRCSGVGMGWPLGALFSVITQCSWTGWRGELITFKENCLYWPARSSEDVNTTSLSKPAEDGKDDQFDWFIPWVTRLLSNLYTAKRFM